MTLAALAELGCNSFSFLCLSGLNQLTDITTQLAYLKNQVRIGKYSGVLLRNKNVCSIPTILLE
jgi:hypothetical protein